MSQKKPIISVIVVNFNGKDYLKVCLNSLKKINFKKDKYEIILVDNDSKDTSVKYAKQNFPEVKIVESKTNLGFAEGCNIGVSHAKGKYLAFLNTDTKVEPEWLSSLYERIKSDPKIAAVNSKILLYFPFIILRIKSDIYLRSEFTNSVNFQPVGVLLENIYMENQSLQNFIRYSKGFYDKEKGLIPAQWTKGEAAVLLPCDPRQEEVNFTITIRSEKSNSDLRTKVAISLKEKKLIEDDLNSHEVKQYNISLKVSEIKKHFLYAVQNSGVVIFKNGYGRDRGAIVKTDHTQFYELDNHFYSKPCELDSFCGGSVLIKKNIFQNVGGFDGSFFMYYEDVDLSLRFKREGWKIFYEPKSVVYHLHAATSGEWSSAFTYNVEKNHLAVLFKHFPLKVILIELFLYLILLILSVSKMLKWRLKEHWELFDEWKEKVDIRIRVMHWVFNNSISLIQKRWSINKIQKVSMREVYRKLY